MRKISSQIFAVVTPFTEKGATDFSALRRYLQWLSRCGAEAIVVNGTTGEFASLTHKERCQLLEHCRDAFGGVIITNVSASSIADAVVLIKHAQGIADHLLLLPP